MAKEATNPKPTMQREWYSLAVHRFTYCTCAVHIQTHFTTLWLWWLHSRCLPNPCQSDIWWLM